MSIDKHGIVEEIGKKVHSGTYQDDLDDFKKNGSSTIEQQRTPHLLFLGKGGSGKTALGNVLINGTSKGDAGPNIGTAEYIETTENEKDGTKYIIHDTRGIGDSTTKVQEMEDELKAVYTDNKEDCIVIVCISQNDRITDNGIKQCFEVCNSLDPKVWDNVIVAITHSEVPLEMRNKANGSDMLEDLKTEWRAQVQEMIKGLNLEAETEVPVCFTSHTEAERPFEDDWKCNLITAILERSGESEGCFGFLVEALKSAWKNILSNSYVPANVPNENRPIDDDQPETTVFKPACATVVMIGWILGGGAGAATALGTGIASSAAISALATGITAGGLTAGAIAGVAAFGAVTIATSGAGALIGAGLGIGAAVAVLLVWLWIKRRRNQ